VTFDIERLGKTVQDQIGAAAPLNGTVFLNVWEALSHVATNRAHDGMRNLTDKVDEVMTNQIMWQSDTEAKTSGLRDTPKRHEARFGKILPLLLTLQRTGAAPALPATNISAIQDQLAALADSVMALQETNWNTRLPSISNPHFESCSKLEAKVRDIHTQLKLLQARIIGNGVQIGGVVFQCFDDVCAWVTSSFQVRRYSLFVDGVSLLDFFSFVSHVDAEKSVSAFYNQQKSGFASMYEARVAASTQNLFPMVFGRTTASGLDVSEYLPALQNPDKWDNSITGL
jgi:hypothetical protein